MPHRLPHKSTIQSHQPPYRPHYLIVTIAPMAPKTRKTLRVPPCTNEMNVINNETHQPPFDGTDKHSIDAERSATGSNTTDIQHDDVLVAASSKAIDTLNVTSNNTTTTQLDSVTGSNTTDGRNTTVTQSTSHQIDAANCLIDGISPLIDTAGIQSTSHQINAADPSVDGTPVKNNQLDDLNKSVS